ncbi:MAG: MOSC domain-containing protein, partial [Alphaproteobacteria bacterium]
NLHFDGVAAWAERAWPGKRIAVGGAVLEVMEPINRCAATEVNPTTALRDLRTLRGLTEGFGHVEMGVYAKVVAAGRVARGAPLREPA